MQGVKESFGRWTTSGINEVLAEWTRGAGRAPNTEPGRPLAVARELRSPINTFFVYSKYHNIERLKLEQ